MLSLQDCLDFSELSEETISIIVEHENVPAIVAVQLGSQLMSTEHGQRRIASYMRQSIARAAQKHQAERVRRLQRAYDELIRRQAANG